MRIIKIKLDFLIGPIIKDVFDVGKREIVTGISLIDNNDEINAINDEISALYSSFYEFDESGNPCKLNKEKLIENREKMLHLLENLISRLDKINDGSFEIEDFATPFIKKL